MPQSYLPTPSEFEALPPTLKRKCFSTLERLRYAEAQTQSDNQRTNHFNSHRLPSGELITSNSISRLRGSIKPLKTHQQRSSGYLLPPGSAYTIANATQENELWFSRLPDKVKRGYFSIEEEALLGRKNKTSDPNALEEVPYKLGTQSNRSVPSLQSPSSRISCDDDSTLNSFFTDTSDSMDTELMNSFGWVDTDLDLSLDDYHKILMESKASSIYTPRVSSVYSPRPSFASIRKSISNTGSARISFQEENLSTRDSKLSPKEKLDEWGSGWAPITIPRIPETAVIQTIHSRKASIVSLGQRKTSSTFNGSTRPLKVEPTPSLPTTNVERWGSSWAPATIKPPTPPEDTEFLVEPQATHYLNPEARLKLRVYLASASKFDEAIEFGFPSLSENDTSVARPLTATPSSGRSLSGSKHSQSSLYGNSTTCSANPPPLPVDIPAPTSLPPSPEFFSIPYRSLSDNHANTSPDRKADLQAQLRKLDRDPNAFSTGREMTIRMTLTRPDLRADESLIYAGQNLSSSKCRPSTSYVNEKDPISFDTLRLDEQTATPFTSIGQKALSLKRFWSRKQ